MKTLISFIEEVGYSEANDYIHSRSGIVGYFRSDLEKESFISEFYHTEAVVAEDRVSYGDWQTPRHLAKEICMRHKDRFGCPDVVIEPTCGLGAFVLAALECFPTVKEIHGVEINENYVKRLKREILNNALLCGDIKFPDINIYQADFFTFDFKGIFARCKEKGCQLALVGNPPWVTNSRQGRFESKNVPIKKNDVGLKGIDAITGKSNFDISEFVILHLLSLADGCEGGMSFLLKNSVARNIVSKQKDSPKPISELEQYNIDAGKEFEVSVEACCMTARIDIGSSWECGIYDFYTLRHIRDYGWIDKSFVSDLASYRLYSEYDGASTYVWRSGIKHDCADILEFEKKEEGFINGLGDNVSVESDMVYPLLKSSDINKPLADSFRKYLLVPQCKPGEDTSALRQTHPLTYSYMLTHAEYFERRKSSIYKGKDRFSIFGVGEYSFKPYKIIVSSLYKDFNFRLVTAVGGKAVMVDDTCYQLDFDTYEEASAILTALKSEEIQTLMRSLAFLDGKRVLTKSLLMRLNLEKYCLDKGLLQDCSTRRMKHSIWRQPSLFD